MALVEIASQTNGWLADDDGNALVGITVVVSGGTVYTSSAGITPLTPVLTNVKGYIPGWIAEGEYTYTAGGSTFTLHATSGTTVKNLYDGTHFGGISRDDIGHNVALGSTMASLNPNTPGDNTHAYYNVMVGFHSGQAMTVGYHNTAIGALTLPANTDGFANSALGEGALFSNTSGDQNTGLGCNALEFNIIGNNNTAVGNGAAANTTADNNTAVGNNALLTNTGGTQNVVIGTAAMQSGSSVSQGVAVGHAALQNATGAFNTGVGWEAGNAITTGSNNTFIGEAAGFTDGTTATTNVTSATCIGERSQATTNNVIVLGKAIANRPNMIFGGVGASAAFGSGVGVFHIANAQTVPSTNPTGGGIIYVEAGALKFRGSSGTITVLGVA